MKYVLKLTAVLCLFTFLAGCAAIPSVKSSAFQVTAPAPAETGGRGSAEYTLFFPDDGTFSYAHNIGADETLYVHEIIKTNTTQIRVTNEGETAIVCNLYDPDDISNALQTLSIEPGKSATFANLISTQTYCIGFQSTQDNTVKVTVSG